MAFGKMFSGTMGVVFGVAVGLGLLMLLGCGGCLMMVMAPVVVGPAVDEARQAAREAQRRAEEEHKAEVAKAEGHGMQDGQVPAEDTPKMMPATLKAEEPAIATEAETPAVKEEEPAKVAAEKRARPAEEKETPEAEKEGNPDLRTWTDATGKHHVEAEFGGVAAGKVKLKKADGSVGTLLLSKLCAEDQAWVKSQGLR